MPPKTYKTLPGAKKEVPKKMGRPRKYDQETLDLMAQSLNRWVEDKVSKKEFGMIKQWCFENKFPPDKLYRYVQEHERLREAYEWAKEWQEYIIAYGALHNRLNSRFAQFFLGCNHNWRTKDESEDRQAALANDFGKYIEYINKMSDHSENNGLEIECDPSNKKPQD